MAKNNIDNREALALQVVENMDFDTLFGALVDRIMADYEHDDDLFQEDWENEDMVEPAEAVADPS